MLPNILATQNGIDKISGKRAEKYLMKFLKLSDVNEPCKKYCIRIFFHISKSSMENAFDLVLKTAETYATENNQLAFRSLMQGFGYDDAKMAMTLLKFINEMLAKSMGDEKRQSKFLAKLEGVGIKEILEKWNLSKNNDIHDQI
jgi:hypothetical protein